MGGIFVLSLSAAANPSLLAAVTLILTRPRPKRLLLAYLVGAVLVSLTCGLLLVFLLAGTKTANTGKHTVSPIFDITLGALIVLGALWVASGRDHGLRAWRAERRQRATEKPTPRWKRTIDNGSLWGAFALGLVMTLPGAEYIAGMDILSKKQIGIALTVAVVVVFNVIQLVILEVPLVAYIVRPQSTDAAVERFNKWIRVRGRDVALVVVMVLGVALIVLGIANL
jgi:hypothetical protein